MIRTNLATRPFYNQRAVHFWLLVVAVLVAAATLFNVSNILVYSTSNTELVTARTRDDAQAVELRQVASRLRSSVDPRQIESSSVQAREANALIDRRTFSWIELFNRFETTLPAEVRITSVRPGLDKDHRIVLTITVLARAVDDVNQFMESLDSTGAFSELLSQQERINDAGQVESTLETVYVPHPSAPTPPPARQSPSAGSGQVR